jgi:hypothetical protein
MPDTPDTITDRRTQMLTMAQDDLASIRLELAAERKNRDTLRDDLRKITAELQGRITEKADRIRDLVQAEADADSLVRSLTPKAPRKRNGQLPTEVEMTVPNPDGLEDDEG